MPVFRLGRDPTFPPPELAEPDGLLAVGGDLSTARLLEAYRHGIFPWYDRPPILWWSPDPRLVLLPEELRVSRSLRATLRRGSFEVRFDTAFRQVIESCASVRRAHEEGTWITHEVQMAYTALHALGHAHSIECWADGELVGGLYGIGLGRAFFGESMFARRTDASKVALVALVKEARRREIALIDCQVTTDHLMSLGAREIPRAEFLRRLDDLLRVPGTSGSWSAPPVERLEGHGQGQAPWPDAGGHL
jgi:leucyl/phenylalanyl-tRNA--protein transferase